MELSLGHSQILLRAALGDDPKLDVDYCDADDAAAAAVSVSASIAEVAQESPGDRADAHHLNTDTDAQ